MRNNTSELYVKGKWIAVPAITVGDKTIVVRGKWLKIATIRSEEWLETELENPENCIEQLKAQTRADIFTFTQKPSASSPKYPYRFELESVAAIRLNSFQEWWESLPQATRKNVRRAERRGVVVKLREFDDDLIKGLAEINNDSPFRQSVRNPQWGKSPEELKKDYGSFLDRSDLICAYAGDEMIGFLKLVYRGEVASILNFLPKLSHDDKRPANAMIEQAVNRCAVKGISCVTYGLFNYGNKRDSSLREFKIRNGFCEMMIPRFYVPLTNWGALCMTLKLHRGLLGVLPQWLITLGLALRSKWFGLKHANQPV